MFLLILYVIYLQQDQNSKYDVEYINIWDSNTQSKLFTIFISGFRSDMNF